MVTGGQRRQRPARVLVDPFRARRGRGEVEPGTVRTRIERVCRHLHRRAHLGSVSLHDHAPPVVELDPVHAARARREEAIRGDPLAEFGAAPAIDDGRELVRIGGAEEGRFEDERRAAPVRDLGRDHGPARCHARRAYRGSGFARLLHEIGPPMSRTGAQLRLREGAPSVGARPGSRTGKDEAMRFMLLQNYGEVESGCAPMTEWTPEEVKAHIDFQHALNDELIASGELVDAQGLAGPEVAKFVVSDGVNAPVITDGPYPESKELLAGYRLIDVESEDRAIAIAAQASAAPGPNAAPILQPIEVRQVMGAPDPEVL
jgi:hypothetical protein